MHLDPLTAFTALGLLAAFTVLMLGFAYAMLKN